MDCLTVADHSNGVIHVIHALYASVEKLVTLCLDPLWWGTETPVPSLYSVVILLSDGCLSPRTAVTLAPPLLCRRSRLGPHVSRAMLVTDEEEALDLSEPPLPEDRLRYCARVMYDGSGFRGWQDQSDRTRSVQQTLGHRFSKRFGFAVKVTGASRTDHVPLGHRAPPRADFRRGYTRGARPSTWTCRRWRTSAAWSSL